MFRLIIKRFEWETEILCVLHLCFFSSFFIALPRPSRLVCRRRSLDSGPNNSSGGNIRSIQLERSTALCSWRVEIVISPTWLMAVIQDVVWVQTMRDCCGNNTALWLPSSLLTGWNARQQTHLCVYVCVKACQGLCRVACNGESSIRAGLCPEIRRERRVDLAK